MKILDCTFRDGGYYNLWDFDKELIEEYLEVMSLLEINYVEIGFRGLIDHGFKGALAYSTDKFLSSLKIPASLKIGVMINVKDLIQSDLSIEEFLRKLFNDQKNSPITFVRIACYAAEYSILPEVVNWLHDKGYTVMINLMQISECTYNEIIQFIKGVYDLPIEVLYIADSLGSLVSEDINRIFSVIKDVWDKPIGIHAHDNLGRALSNTLCAVDKGATWLDCTVYGMGRGPGNTKTELLLLELENQESKLPYMNRLIELINNFFEPLLDQYKWGTNVYYYLAGKYHIHPSYVQEMLNDLKYKDYDILAIINQLKSVEGNRFNKSNLEDAYEFYSIQASGEWSPLKTIKGNDVLILGTGPSLRRYKNEIEEFIQVKKPFVIALNTNNCIKSDLINLYAAIHPAKLVADYEVHLQNSVPLALPYSMLKPNIKQLYEKKIILDFGVVFGAEKFKIHETYCEIPDLKVFTYAIAIALSGKSSQILLAGFDGYESSDIRNFEINSTLYKLRDFKCNIQSVTPTKYNMKSVSIYTLVDK